MKDLDDMSTEDFTNLLFNNCDMKTNMVEEVKPKQFRKLIWKHRLSTLWIYIISVAEFLIILLSAYHLIMFFHTEEIFN